MNKSRLTALILLLIISIPSLAQTRYVSDELLINLRTGAGDQYRITKILRSGTRMTVLEESENGEWVRVQTQAGDEGWVRSQYLQSEPIARQRLAQAEARIAELSNRGESVGSENAQLRQENQQLKSELQAAQAEASRLSRELEELKQISANAVNLNRANQELMEERRLLQTEIDVLKAETERLADDSRQTWFLYGALAVGLGVVITLILQSLRSRRRYSEWR